MVFCTYSNSANMGHLVSRDTQIVQELQAAAGHIHGAPVYWNSSFSYPQSYPLVYIWSENDFLKAFHFNGTNFDPNPVMQSTFQDPPGMPGGMLSISANGNTPGSGIVWAMVPYSGDAERNVVPGVLRAFDAANISNQIWNSKQNAARDDFGNFAKFCPPTIANGKVYIGTFSNAVYVYGLLPPNFSVNAQPAARSVVPGNPTTFTVSSNALNGFNGPVALSVSGLPSGATVSFAPATLTGAGTSTLTINTLGSTPVGSSTLTVTGTSGSPDPHCSGFAEREQYRSRFRSYP